MKTFNVISLIITILILGCTTPSFSQTPEQNFQKGLMKEKGDGDLDAAIGIYNGIVNNQTADESLRAKALLHVGLCYEKLGRTEAAKAYQNLLDKFPGQKSEVAIARERLARLIHITTKVPNTPLQITSQKVWSGPDADYSGTPSPDGRFLTYSDLETGNLAIRILSTGKTRLLTNEGTWDDTMQFNFGSIVSPNSRQIAYSWCKNNYEIRLIDIDDLQPKVLYGNKDEDVYPVAWSSDEKIIYARSYLNKSNQCRILAITVANGDINVLKTFDSFYWMYLTVSPDNKYIAYDVSKDKDEGNYDIHLISTDGKNETSLVKHPANDRLMGWFPDNNQILFKSDRSRSWDAWTVSVLNGKVSGEPRRLLTGIGQVSPIGFSTNGTYYYSIHTRNYSAFTAPFDAIKGSLEIKLHQPLLGSIRVAEYSPDGKFLAYTKELITKAGPGWYFRPLFILDLKTGKERNLSSSFRIRHPRWSPDGKILLVSGYDTKRKIQKDYEGGIYTIEVENDQVTELIAFSNSINDTGVPLWARSAVEWSNDQKSIYYTTNDKLINRVVKTGEKKTLLHNRKFGVTLDLSPDGNKLLLCAGNQLMVIPTSGGKAKKLFSVAKANRFRNAVWSPDNNYIFFTENMSGMNNGGILWRISPKGKNPIKVWQSKGTFSSISIHPKGQKAVLSTLNQEIEIWQLANLLSGE